MNNSSETKKFAVIFTLAILLCFGVVALAVYALFFKNDTANSVDVRQVDTTFLAKSDDSLDSVGVGAESVQNSISDNSAWQQEIHEVVVPDEGDVSVDDLSADTDSGEHAPESEIDFYGSSERGVSINHNEPQPIAPYMPDYSADEVQLESVSNPSFEKLGQKVSNAYNCGEIELPSGIGLALFAFSAEYNPAVICLGESVAKKCRLSKVEILSESSLVGNILVGDLLDGQCGVGTYSDPESAILCSVEKMMNANSEEQLSLSAWQKVFKSEPGKTFASLYINNQSAFSDPSVAEKFDCKTYSLN
ncbi:hypothetical protein KC926_01375 [Candidatus Kaiserbacteria bacterium]|nr:hypothetical protein [Candidatus Kaiserbacteria bacterium]